MLVVYTMSAFHFQEMLKFPMLVNHYKIHLNQNPNMDVLDFMYIHYIECSKDVSDYDEDQKLPFKNIDETGENVAQYFFQDLQTIVIGTFINETPAHVLPNFVNTFVSQFSSAIWQPPKLGE
jgi:hypothetical protein